MNLRRFRTILSGFLLPYSPNLVPHFDYSSGVRRPALRYPQDTVWRDFLPLFEGLVVAAAILAARELYRRRTHVSPPRPGISMEETWRLWLAGMAGAPDGRLQPAPASPAALDEAQRGTVEAGLLEIERRCLASDHPRLAVRSATLEAATSVLYLEAILPLGEVERRALLRGYEEGGEPRLRGMFVTTGAMWTVLRHYSRLRYDDAVPDDWFHQYMQVARPYIREKVRLARDHVIEMDEGAGRLVEIYDALLDELRRKCLAARPKRRFPPPDLTAPG